MNVGTLLIPHEQFIFAVIELEGWREITAVIVNVW